MTSGMEIGGTNDAEWEAEKAKTLRDQFAMAALTGWFSTENPAEHQRIFVADQCYAMADAMMKARG